MLNLNCWLLGEDPVEYRVFVVEIAKADTVSFLKGAIQDRRMYTLSSFDADFLDLWKVCC